MILGQPVIPGHGLIPRHCCFPEQGTVPVNPAALTEECEATPVVVVHVFP